MAVTQFEETEARRAFPCFDEPEFKAEFTLNLIHSSTYVAVSNTEGIVTDNGDGTSTTIFATTPRMSTYLLAFVVSDYGFISNEAAIGVNETSIK